MSAKPVSSWWGPPQNFRERKQERKISWLELFYDLVYVACIGQLTHYLAAHPSWSTLGHTFVMFSLVFWSWVNGSQYYDLHGYDGIRTRVLTLLQMLAVAAVAITLKDAFEGNHQSFVVAFSSLQILITYLWFSVGFYDRSHRMFNKFYTVNYLIGLALLIISFFLTPENAFWLWVVALLFNLTPGLTVARTVIRELKKIGQVFSASDSLVERFGLFTIIVLGESILSIVSGVSEVKDKDPTAWIAFIIGILITFLLWSIYFDMTSEQETKRGYSYLQLLIFLHLPLLTCLGIVGACVRVLLTELQAYRHPEVVWMFCLAIAIILLMVTGLTFIMKEEEEDRSYIRPVSQLLIVTALVILCVPLVERFLNTLAFFSVVAAILFTPVYVGIKSWIRYKFSGKR